MFFKQPRIRRYEITPYYYDKDKAEQDDGPRIRFQRITRSEKPIKKPMRKTIILAIGMAFIIWYFHSQAKQGPIKVESIQVEDISNGN